MGAAGWGAWTYGSGRGVWKARRQYSVSRRRTRVSELRRYDIILDGIFNLRDHAALFERLHDDHCGQTRIYQFDTGLDATIRRHAGRPLSKEFGEDNPRLARRMATSPRAMAGLRGCSPRVVEISRMVFTISQVLGRQRRAPPRSPNRERPYRRSLLHPQPGMSSRRLRRALLRGARVIVRPVVS